MEPTHFDRLTRSLSIGINRRSMIARITALGLATGLARASGFSDVGVAAAGMSADGKKRKKRKKRRCPKDRRCGKHRCCNRGQICAGGVCLIGQGSCSAGADSCLAGAPILCTENCVCVTTTEGATRCTYAGDGAVVGPCGGCTSSDDCAAFGAGAFCVAAGIGCGCQAGEGMCAQPCVG